VPLRCGAQFDVANDAGKFAGCEDGVGKRLDTEAALVNLLPCMRLLPLFLTAALSASAWAESSAVPAPAALPKPAGLKAVSETAYSAIYSAPGSAEAVRAEAIESFSAAGWLPYGEAGETQYFKKGKLKAQVTVSASPVKPGTSMVSYQVEAMSADIPLPAGGKDAQFSNSTKRLTFASTQTPDEVDAAYRKLLAPTGWSTTMAKPEKFDFDYCINYRHPSEGLIELVMRPGEDKLLVTATYKTQAEVEAEKAKAAAQGDVLRKKLAAEANAPKPEVNLTLPKSVKQHFAVKNGYTIELASGSAMEAAKKIGEQFVAQGWKAGQPLPLAPETGMLEYTKDSLRVTLTYMDPGPVPAQISIAAAGVTIKAKP